MHPAVMTCFKILYPFSRISPPFAQNFIAFSRSFRSRSSAHLHIVASCFFPINARRSCSPPFTSTHSSVSGIKQQSVSRRAPDATCSRNAASVIMVTSYWPLCWLFGKLAGVSAITTRRSKSECASEWVPQSREPTRYTLCCLLGIWSVFRIEDISGRGMEKDGREKGEGARGTPGLNAQGCVAAGSCANIVPRGSEFRKERWVRTIPSSSFLEFEKVSGG
ncbi:hypothetical protein B0H15DRAFT_856728 [Mycena belliarum]|uniref:Uncharacterized protein n=1 Tax=Mycena belliarum TaxID=1033014 RepID=A0AAD6TUN1_9AGAR|nr:hypothetical protein B0H15DRAFT_856728 [Mycena belliae]